MKKFRTTCAIGFSVLLCHAVPAKPAPAPVPDNVPVALLVDNSNGQVLYTREADRRFVPASVVKVMTAYTAFRLMDEGTLSPSTPYLITPELEDEWSGEGSTMFLKAGERPTIGELLLGATTVSGNDASVALANAAAGSVVNWLALMNENAAALGMRDTHFGSPNGFPDEGRTFSTAHDLALLGQALVTQYPNLYRRYFGHRTLTWRGLTQRNHDPITGRVEGADGIKTGFTNEAGYTFLGSAERNGRRLILVLAGVPTSRERASVAEALLEWGFADFEIRSLADKGSIIGMAQVQNGNSRKVALRLAQDVQVALPEDTNATMKATIRYNGPVQAPIATGAQIAHMRIEVEGLPSFDVPLEAAEEVAEANFLQRIGNGLAGLFG